MLPHYQLKIAVLYNILISNVEKLVPNFFDKEKYVIHYENWEFCLRLGLKLKKVVHIFFSKNISSKERVKPCFFVTFNIISKHIFPENFMEFPQVVQKI